MKTFNATDAFTIQDRGTVFTGYSTEEFKKGEEIKIRFCILEVIKKIKGIETFAFDGSTKDRNIGILV